MKNKINELTTANQAVMHDDISKGGQFIQNRENQHKGFVEGLYGQDSFARYTQEKKEDEKLNSKEEKVFDIENRRAKAK